jgi:hypothetical protein
MASTTVNPLGASATPAPDRALTENEMGKPKPMTYEYGDDGEAPAAPTSSAERADLRYDVGSGEGRYVKGDYTNNFSTDENGNGWSKDIDETGASDGSGSPTASPAPTSAAPYDGSDPKASGATSSGASSTGTSMLSSLSSHQSSTNGSYNTDVASKKPSSSVGTDEITGNVSRSS